VVTIGNHVWLADGVTVLKGVSIGDNAVAGINSVISHEVAAGTIVAGNPAQVVRCDVTWSR
jgi:acetyltransferase-like isoleucine patch superfamily enzyme